MKRPAPLSCFSAALALGAACLPALSLAQETPPAPPAVPAPAEAAAQSGVFRSSVTVDRTPLNRDAPMRGSYAGMLEKVQPAVVTVLTGIDTPEPTRRRMSRDEALLRYFMGVPPEAPAPSGPGGAEDRWQQLGLGTGVIVSKSGYILTNRHVVIPPDAGMSFRQMQASLHIKISVPGREGTLRAEVVDFSADADVAVLKVDAKDLPTAVLADSDQVKVGDVVFALGAPFGIDKTVTMGIISARRNDEVLAGFEKQELLQTDASINPGNSGGPLIDSEGRVVGINTAIYSQNGGSLGIGFAIPINKAIAAADALSRPRGLLGVDLAPIKRRAAAYYGLPGGAYVTGVRQGTAAEHAGLREGDVIFRLDDKDVIDDEMLVRELSSRAPGESIALSLLRDERKMEVRVKLGERANRFLPEGGATSTGAPKGLVAGMSLSPLQEEERAAHRLTAGGLLITDVEPNSPAANCGLEKGDVIVRINDREPATAEDAGEALGKSRNGASMLHIRRGNTRKLVVMDAGER